VKRVVWNELGAAARRSTLARPRQRSDEVLQTAVRAIVDQVQQDGWRGLVDIAMRIDGEAPRAMEVESLAANARRRLPSDQVEAMEFAASRIRAFHETSLPSDFVMETAPGLTVRKTWRAIERVGIYVPGGKTPLFSSLMMLAIPARAAGVSEIVTVTPPQPDGGLDELIALAGKLSGIERIWTVGGAQAIAALAFGAGDIPGVDKIAVPATPGWPRQSGW